MNILGISGQDRDAAAALVQDGRVVAAIEEEKLARIRHVGMTYSGGLPHHAIRYCLERGGLKPGQIDYVAYYLEPDKLLRRGLGFRSSRLFHRPGLATFQALAYYAVDSLDQFRQQVKSRRMAEALLAPGGRFMPVNHQLAHAASAFYASGFDQADVMVAGNRGDMTSTALMSGTGNRLTVIKDARYPDSVGMLYSAVTGALGFDSSGDEHKTTWLSATGIDEFGALFADILQIDSAGMPRVNLDYFDASFMGEPRLNERLFKATGLPEPNTEESSVPIAAIHRNVAASLQRRVNDVLCDVASRRRKASGNTDLCLAGGVALNSLSNAAIETRAGYERVFVQPAAGNAGCSLGSALYVWHDVLGNKERTYRMDSPFLGPEFDEEEIKSVLDNCKLEYEYFLTEDKLIAEVASLLSRGRIVGWFRGRMEFGPRALGARSILASPTTELMRDNLNSYIKHREDFRPFSAAVPEDRAAEFFEPSNLTSFMQGVCKVIENQRSRIPAAVFGNGIARVQTVGRTANASFWKLIMKFGELTGVPVLLNTSFNLFGEPVVATPREAVRGLYCSGIDCLAVGNFLIKK